MPTSSSFASRDTRDTILERLPTARAAAAIRSVGITGTADTTRAPDTARTTLAAVRWQFPPLPPAVRATVEETWHLDIASDAGADPRGIPTFAAILAAARTEQVLLAVSARTNLVLAGTTVRVVGDGPLADRLTIALTRIGARVIRRSEDPRVRLRARLDGLGADTTAPADATEPADTLEHGYVLATGEGHGALDPTDLTGIVADVSLGGDAFATAAAPLPEARPHVHVRGNARIVDIPPPLPEDGATATPQQWRIADTLIAASILSTVTADPAALDVLLAEAAMA